MKNKNNTKKTFSGVWRPGCWLKGAVPALLLMVTLAASPVLASHHEKHLDLQSFMQSDLRALAMGGGFTSVARGESSLLYNPAGLSQYLMGVKVAGQFTLDMEDNYFLTDTVKLMPIPGMDQLMNVFEKLKVVKNRNTTLGLIDYYDEYAGESQHFRWERYYNLVANLGAMGFGFGVGMIKQDRLKLFFNDNGDGTFDILNQTPPDNLYTEHKTVEGMLYGFSLHTKDGQLLLGLGLKDLTYIERTKTEQFTDTMTLSLPKDGYSYETRAFDLGIIWRLAFMGKLRGQWGMTMHNLGGLELDNPNTVQNPVDPPDRLVVPSTYNLGISINPDLGPFKLLMVAELEDFTNNIKVHVSDTQNFPRTVSQRRHFGIELGFWELSTGNHVFNVRAGNHRGRGAYGWEINLWESTRLIYTHYWENFGYLFLDNAANKKERMNDFHPFKGYLFSVGYSF